MKKRGFTLVELLVVIAIIALLLAILAPALSRVRRLAQRVVCGANLKGLGNAMMVYASASDDDYPVQGAGADHTWDYYTGKWKRPRKDWDIPEPVTVGASLYLLVRDADVSPKSFVCKGGDEHGYDGENDGGQGGEPVDLVELWDFGRYEPDAGPPGSGTGPSYGPKSCVSYSYQLPYDVTGAGTTPPAYPPDSSSDAAMALMADKNPWFDPKLNASSPNGARDGSLDEDSYVSFIAYIWWNDDTREARWQLEVGNTQPHLREGQNVLFADAHVEFEKRSDIGVRRDNIYAPYGGSDNGPWNENNRRKGVLRPSDAGEINGCYPKDSQDNFLVNDDDRTLGE